MTIVQVILNPGEDIGDSDYYTFANQIVTFEDTYARYQTQEPYVFLRNIYLILILIPTGSRCRIPLSSRS
jgi:hypothetical protein